MKASLLIVVILMWQLTAAQSSAEDPPSPWEWIVPDHVKLHFAGEIGFLSPGAGYELFKKKNGELDVFGGFLPEAIGGDNIVSIAGKFHYMPWKKEVLKNKYLLEPISLGVLVYHSFGEDLNKAKDDNLYPNGYYWWTVGTRFGPFFGSRITQEFKEPSFFKALTFYVEFGTNDLYFFSWKNNRSSIPLYQIWNSSIGLKARF